jgi:hypothetical protein
MAQAFFERHAPADMRAESAGSEPRREGVWPAVVAAMAEVGLDLSNRRPKKLSVEMQLHAIPDPAGRPLEEVRTIRDTIDARVQHLLEHRLDLIRTDRTAHELRLEKLLPVLAQEFAGLRTGEEIRTCADAILSQFADAPVRSHVMAIACRKARECLRAEHCDAAPA